MNKPSGPSLFVSHASSQRGVAEHVERALNAKGVRCWIAPRDVEPGASFARAIPDAISESSAVLLLFCSSSVKSPHVERELILADQLGKPIIPLKIEKIIDPGGLRYHLAAAQWIDWLEQRDAAIDRIAARAHGFAPSAGDEPALSDLDEPAPPAAAAELAPPAPAEPPPPPPPPPPSDQVAPAPPFYPSHQPMSAAAGSPLPGAVPQGAGWGEPSPPPPPHQQWHQPPPPHGGGSGGAGLWIGIGLGVLALIAIVVWLASLDSESSGETGTNVVEATGNSSATTVTSDPVESGEETSEAVTEEWFAGIWSETRDCSEMYRFDLGGSLTGPAGEEGTWSIENGDTLVTTVDGDEQRREVRRVSDDEVTGADGPAYRCMASTPRG